MEHKPNLCTDTLDHFSSTLMDALFSETTLISAMWEDEKEFFKRKERPNQLFTTIHEYYTKLFHPFQGISSMLSMSLVSGECIWVLFYATSDKNIYQDNIKLL